MFKKLSKIINFSKISLLFDFFSQRDQELKTALAELNDARNDARTQLSEISQMKEDLKLMDNRFKMIQQVIKVTLKIEENLI